MPSSSVYEKIAILIFFIALFFLPLFFIPGNSYYFSNISKFILFFITVHISAFLFLYTQYRKKNIMMPNHILFSSAFFIFLFIFISALFSKILIASWVSIEMGSAAFLFFYLPFFFFFLSIYIFRKKELISYVYETIAFSFFIIFAVSMTMALFNGLNTVDNIKLFLGDITNITIFAGLIFIISLFLYKFLENKKMRICALAIFFLSLITIFLTFAGETKPSFSFAPVEHITILQETVKESSLRALLGSGPNTILHQRDLYAPEQKIAQSWNVSPVTQTGLLGGFSWAIFFFLFLFFGIQSFLQKNKLAVMNFIVALYLWIFTFFHSMNFALLILTFLFTGIYIATLSYSDNERHNMNISLEKKWARAVFISIIFIVFTASIFGVTVYSKKTISYFYFQNALAVQNEEALLNGVARAIQKSKEDTYYRFLADFYIKKTEESAELYVFESRDREVVKYGSLAVENARKATEINPYNYRNWHTLGKIYLVFQRLDIDGVYEHGQRAYSEAYVLSPKNEVLLLERAELAFRAGDEHYKELLSEYPNKIEVQKKIQGWGL